MKKFIASLLIIFVLLGSPVIRPSNLYYQVDVTETIFLIDCMLFQTRRLFPSIIPKRPVILNEADAGGEVKNLPHFPQILTVWPVIPSFKVPGCQ